jgi:CheY-like chemotaxis protein
MRSMKETHSTLLVALTGWSGDEMAGRARAAGFDLYLTKPVSAVALVSALAATHTLGPDHGGPDVQASTANHVASQRPRDLGNTGTG